MPSELTGLRVYDYQNVRKEATIKYNETGTVEVDEYYDPTTAERTTKYGGDVVYRHAETAMRIAHEGVLGAEKVTNGDCETFTSGLVTGWTEWDTGGVLTPAEEAVDVYAGSKSQKLTRGAGATYAAVTTNTMSLTKGKYYLVAFALKVAAGTPRVLVNNSASTVTLHNFGNLTPADWTAYSQVVYCTETRTDYVVRFDSDSYATFTCLIDSVSVKELTTGTLNVADNLTTGGTIAAGEAITTEATVTARTGLTSGVAATVRGILELHNGTSTNTPGYLKVTAGDGTVWYLWATAAGAWRFHTSAPTADTDGTDALDIQDTLDVAGAVTLGSTLDVTGDITTSADVAGVNADFTGTLNADGAATLGSTLDVTGAATVGGTLEVTGNVTGDGTVTAGTGISSTTGDIEATAGNVYATGGQAVAGDDGVTRGRLVAYGGDVGDADEPGVLVLYALDGTPYYLWATTAGVLRIHTTLPTADTDGSAV